MPRADRGHRAVALAACYLAMQPTPANSKGLHAVQIYDCRASRHLGQVLPEGVGAKPAANHDENSFLTWSPDGSRLLLYDTALGSLTIWGLDTLGR